LRTDDKKKGPEPSEHMITTPNGKRGVYCNDLGGDRAKCYEFVSHVCHGGYSFLRESEDAVMLECKLEEFRN
jgi:hypothetical protein